MCFASWLAVGTKVLGYNSLGTNDCFLCSSELTSGVVAAEDSLATELHGTGTEDTEAIEQGIEKLFIAVRGALSLGE